ncbi:MAG: hypothetical protein ACRDZN_10335 [Acidimicrobiales bacterium]
MVYLKPDDPDVLATAVADSLVVAADDRMGPTASVFYWHNAQPLVAGVVAAVAALGDDRLDQAAAALRREPSSYGPYRALHQALTDLARRAPGRTAELFDAAWRAETVSRLGYRIGPDHDTAVGAAVPPADLAALLALPPPVDRLARSTPRSSSSSRSATGAGATGPATSWRACSRWATSRSTAAATASPWSSPTTRPVA